MTFERDMKEAKKLIVKACEKTVRGTALRLFTDIIKATPVGNRKLWKINQDNDGQLQPKGYIGGRLRNNWQCTIKRPATGTIKDADKSGRASQASVKATTPQYDLNDVMFLTNNLPYADRIENGKWSTQRPYGMVKTNVRKFRPILNRLARGEKI